jgi:uncharacterized protein YbjT (DUF2867 family)
MSRGLAAVTGATGFLGRHVVRSLAESGWRIRVLARRDVIHPLWRDLEIEVVLGDLGDQAVLSRLCRGADLVVHTAGLIKARDRQAFEAVNVEGARRLAEATGGPMLLVSSLAAREPGLSDYAATKRLGEEAARMLLGDRLTVVRPPALYGPGDPETLPLFKAAAASPVLPLFDPGARIALMHVHDAARQIAALADLPGVQCRPLRPSAAGLWLARNLRDRRPRLRRRAPFHPRSGRRAQGRGGGDGRPGGEIQQGRAHDQPGKGARTAASRLVDRTGRAIGPSAPAALRPRRGIPPYGGRLPRRRRALREVNRSTNSHC